jgi:hypothetical protein
MNKNHWGEPDDIEPFPEWMLAETYRNGGPTKKSTKTLTSIIEETLKKPAIPLETFNAESLNKSQYN